MIQILQTQTHPFVGDLGPIHKHYFRPSPSPVRPSMTAPLSTTTFTPRKQSFLRDG